MHISIILSSESPSIRKFYAIPMATAILLTNSNQILLYVCYAIILTIIERKMYRFNVKNLNKYLE